MAAGLLLVKVLLHLLVLIRKLLPHLFDLLVGFLFSDDALTLSVLHAPQHLLVRPSLLLLFLTLLADLHLHELELLLIDGLVLLPLALGRFVVLLELLVPILKLSDALILLLCFTLLQRRFRMAVLLVFDLQLRVLLVDVIQLLLGLRKVRSQHLLRFHALLRHLVQSVLNIRQLTVALEQAVLLLLYEFVEVAQLPFELL